MKQYDVCSTDFNETSLHHLIQKGLLERRQDQARGDQDLNPDFKENYNLSDDLGISVVDLNTEPSIMSDLQDNE